MIKDADIAQFIDRFPAFRSASAQTLSAMKNHAQIVTFPAEKMIYHEGDACNGIAFLLSGEIRVFKSTESGKEITLYEIEPGETCILNASCIISGNGYPAQAETVAESTVLLLPAPFFRELINTLESMREFVFNIFTHRLSIIISLVEEVSFRKMDERLNDYLVEKSENGVLTATHQKIANDLGTSREVVSRLLKDLENKGEIALSRNKITLSAN